MEQQKDVNREMLEAAEKGHHRKLEKALAAGANPNGNGWPLSRAAVMNRERCVEVRKEVCHARNVLSAARRSLFAGAAGGQGGCEWKGCWGIDATHECSVNLLGLRQGVRRPRFLFCFDI